MPSANDASITVRTAAEPSAPARDGERGDALDGAHRRREREPDGADRGERRPPRGSPPTAAPTTAIAATISGPKTKNTSCSQASSAYAVSRRPWVGEQARPERAHARAERRQRRAGQRGARDQREHRRAVRREQREAAEGGRDRRTPSGSSTRTCPTRSTSRPQSGQPMALASDDAATTTPATAYERPSPRISSSVASGAMPDREPAEQRSADDPRDARRARARRHSGAGPPAAR